MTNLLNHKLRFSDVAFSVDMTPKTLRNWLQRGQVDLISETPAPGAWRQFVMADVAILSVVRQLVNFGVNVETASALAITLLIEMPGESWLRGSHTDCLMFWVNREVVLTRSDDGDADDPSDWRLQIGWKGEARDASAYLTLSPRPILERAFQRALDGACIEDAA